MVVTDEINMFLKQYYYFLNNSFRQLTIEGVKMFFVMHCIIVIDNSNESTHTINKLSSTHK